MPESLKKEESELSVVIEKSDGTKVAIQRYRAITMISDDGTRFVMFACENQGEVHYAMPVRTMLYDALGYAEQIQEIRKVRTHGKELKTSAEFLSGLKKGDLLVPVVTLVFYYDEEEWDGSRDLSRYGEDLQMVFGMLRYRKNRSGLSDFIRENAGYFSNISEETYQALKVMLGVKGNLRIVDNQIRNKKEGGIDVCQALEEIYQDGVKEGVERVIHIVIQDYIDEGFGKDKILWKLQRRFSLTQEQAEAYLEDSWRAAS